MRARQWEINHPTHTGKLDAYVGENRIISSRIIPAMALINSHHSGSVSSNYYI